MTVSEESRDREVRAAQNQSLFREINERVKELNEGFSLVLPIGEWVCECANETCTERISMSAQEYEEIRSDGVRFFVAPSEEHVWPDVEVVTKRHDPYWVVERLVIVERWPKTQTLVPSTGPEHWANVRGSSPNP
jgi:hypothetical protein